MNMELTSAWRKNLAELSNRSKMKVEIIKNPSMGDALDYYTFYLIDVFKNREIRIKQVVKVGGGRMFYSFLMLESSFEASQHYKLSVWQKSAFDFLLPMKRVKSGNINFDKVFSISSVPVSFGSTVFCDNMISDLLIENRMIVINISSSKSHIVSVKLKCMEQKLYPTAEVLKLLDMFKIILSKIG